MMAGSGSLPSRADALYLSALRVGLSRNACVGPSQIRSIRPRHGRVRSSRLAPASSPSALSGSPSTTAAYAAATQIAAPRHRKPASSLAILPLTAVMRTLSVTTITSVPGLLGPSLAALSFLANSQSAFLNPDRNGLLNFLLRQTIYSHFCAGETPAEVSKTISGLKQMGYSGVILGYGREVVMDEDEANAVGISKAEDLADAERNAKEVREWREGTMQTVELADAGDFVALKFTGAGRQALSHLLNGLPPSPDLEQAIVDVCDRARDRHVRLLLDAEQYAVQDTIDDWVLRFQRRYNRGFTLHGEPRALIYGTYQAYRRSTPQTLAGHLATAQTEGFVLGVKLVRGAYLGSDPRHTIWSTKEETDNAYDSIAHSLMTRRYGPILQSVSESAFPQADLVLATHNRESVGKARALRNQQARMGQPMVEMAYGQLQGMADDISCQLVSESKVAAAAAGEQDIGLVEKEEAPRPYKYLVWGTVGECTKYLLRRGHENRDAASRTKDTRQAMLQELRRRTILNSM